MKNLSILIPANNEMFVSKTVENILAKIEENIEVMVFLDGAPSNLPLPDDLRIRSIYFEESIGHEEISEYRRKKTYSENYLNHNFPDEIKPAKMHPKFNSL